jgi:hypothetical protein
MKNLSWETARCREPLSHYAYTRSDIRLTLYIGSTIPPDTSIRNYFERIPVVIVVRVHERM